MNWKQQAACTGIDTSIFFPRLGEKHKERLALKICSECDVINECRQHSIELAQTVDVQGIFGGWTQLQRLQYMKEHNMTWHRSGYDFEVNA